MDYIFTVPPPPPILFFNGEIIQEQRYPFISVTAVLQYDCQCLGILTCAHMLMQTIAHGGCTDTVRQSTLEVDYGRERKKKIKNCGNGDTNPRQYYAWLFSRTLCQLSYPRSRGEWTIT